MPVHLLVRDPQARDIVMSHVVKQKGLDPELVLRFKGSFSDLTQNMGGGLVFEVLNGILEDLQVLSDSRKSPGR
jgi:hypothetical protein